MPLCLNSLSAVSQPYGSVQGAQIVELAPGQTCDVTLEIRRVAIPADEPVRFIAPDGRRGGAGADTSRGTDGDRERGAFGGDLAVVRLSVSADASTMGDGQTLPLRIRKQSAPFPVTGKLWPWYWCAELCRPCFPGNEALQSETRPK